MLFRYKGSRITASSRKEAISKIVAGNGYITVDKIDEDNYKEYIGKKVNVKGDVNLQRLYLRKLPITFGKVDGDFDCLDNKLTSLIGCPTEVGRDFNCEYNNKEFTENDVKSLCKVGGSIYV